MMSLAQSLEEPREEGPGQKEIFTRGQRVYTKDGKLASVTYDGVVYAPDDTGKLVPKEQPEVRADGGVTILPAETLIDGLNARDINYVRNLFEQRGYEATPEEIKKIVTNSRINDLEGASQGSIEVILSGEVGTYVNENTVNIKDLYRIFQAELGRNQLLKKSMNLLEEQEVLCKVLKTLLLTTLTLQ
jgi:hypothetical protein